MFSNLRQICTAILKLNSNWCSTKDALSREVMGRQFLRDSAQLRLLTVKATYAITMYTCK